MTAAHYSPQHKTEPESQSAASSSSSPIRSHVQMAWMTGEGGSKEIGDTPCTRVHPPRTAACPRALAKCRLCACARLAERGTGHRQATCCRRRFLEASSRPPATPFQGLASSFLTVSVPPSPNLKVNGAHTVRTSVLGEGRWAQAHCGILSVRPEGNREVNKSISLIRREIRGT
jgi:hypothetical protein